jgi:sterol desaturase/sphingolipid hydroxylase (fatty acid hydroxylase superfamily)
MTERDFQLLRAGTFVVALAVAAALQRLRPHASRRGSVRVNAGLWAVDGLVTTVVCGACVCTAARWAAGARVGLLNVAAARMWSAILATVVVLDLVSYLWHRANHVVPVLWRFHRVHHSDPSFTVSTALRFHPGELVLSIPLRLLAVVLLGAPVMGVVVFEALFAVSNLVEHGDIDLPLSLERVLGGALVTPALHRFHHTRAGSERDHNFGTIFAVWDRLLATYRPSTSATLIDVGLTEIAEPPGLGAALMLPLRRLEPVR